MYFFYNIAVLISSFLLKIGAVFNSKIELFTRGRKDLFQKLGSQIKSSDQVIWFHCASLGEFEQARPIIETLKRSDLGQREFKILVTFFSPSGFEIQKNYKGADIVSYLPLDSKKNSRKFVEIVNPKIAVFVKYEFWPNLLRELKTKQIRTILISGIFRKDQTFFRSYGGWMRRSLHTFSHFFVQNEHSKKLLKGIDFTNVTVTGDTRFDRVFDILKRNHSLPEIADFKNDKQLLVAGSTWPEDEKLLIDYINNHAELDEKFIIAPHNVNRNTIEKLQASFVKKAVLHSQIKNTHSRDAQILIIDSIGILTKIYSYADIAFVGGGFKTGLHNVLEPATFGVPVIIGPNFQKFKEAIDLVELGGCISINSFDELKDSMKTLFQDQQLRTEKGHISQKYVENGTGATQHILNYIDEHL